MSLPTQCAIIPDSCSRVASTIRTATLVPTTFEKPVKTTDLRGINSSSALASLKKRDPFMYHSIPACRKSALHSKEADVSVLRLDNRSIERQVTRQTRVSTECHADVLMEDLVAEYDSIDRPTESTASENRSHAPTVCTTTLIPTIFEKPSRTMVLKDIDSASKLVVLKARDPFIYYSIPALRKAAWHNNEADVSVLRHDNRFTERKIPRQTRVSTECHVDVLMEDLIAECGSMDFYNETMENYDAFYENYFSCDMSRSRQRLL